MFPLLSPTCLGVVVHITTDCTNSHTYTPTDFSKTIHGVSLQDQVQIIDEAYKVSNLGWNKNLH